MAMTLHDDSYTCDGDCGAEVVLKSRNPIGMGILHSVMETLGWTTRDVKKKGKTQTLVFCDFCQKRANLIANGR